MTLSQRILAGLCAGVAVGLFLGDLVRPLQVVADGFVRLLQMTVLPYVTVSTIVSLGSLDFATARRLGLRAGGVLAGLWALAIGFAFLVPAVFPPGENASFFSASLVEEPATFDFVGLYIPANPFHSLANNIVPAVVLFSVVVGLALIGVERKAALIDVLGVASATRPTRPNAAPCSPCCTLRGRWSCRGRGSSRCPSPSRSGGAMKPWRASSTPGST